ncbi:c-type cytochrome [Pseudothauera rhizosphaerae]|uniref:Cytochrome c n=1 Tax=Pseudothauera rhizosphaerae TaxID=2565932 RepID=A0A4S4AQN6_9RHOO|nr:cytochrome c [Pseudothauera rhizosphaerae]THF62069.1 cytochrome c [Pseudothauera rhizosphaerae]
MKKLLAGAVFGVAALSIATAAVAQTKPEDAIKFRQAGYAFMAWNMGKIKAQVVDGAVPYNKDQVAAAASVIAAVANSGMGALYPAGSDKGSGFHETKVKGEFFTDGEGVAKVAVSFNKAANDLAAAAATGDQGAIKAAFGEVGKACKACHDSYRAK